MGLLRLPTQRPASMTPGTNGKLMPNQLSMVGMPGLGTVLLEKNTARQWNALALAFAAKHPKYRLTTTGGGAYRRHESIVALFFQRMVTVVGILLAQVPYVTRVYLGKKYYLRRGAAPCAAPEWFNPVTKQWEGGSNHGWGLAIDAAIFELATGITHPITFNRTLWESFRDMAPAYGFSWEGALPTNLEGDVISDWYPGRPKRKGDTYPKAFEAWHIRNVASKVPQKVLDLEAFFAKAV